MSEPTPALDADLLALLACPACEDRPSVRLVGDGLVCDRCHRIYPIRDGIPEMLVEAATFEPGFGPEED
ncbi:MAG: Trm112 family protein [Chthonomonadales bacterium]